MKGLTAAARLRSFLKIAAIFDFHLCDVNVTICPVSPAEGVSTSIIPADDPWRVKLSIASDTDQLTA